MRSSGNTEESTMGVPKITLAMLVFSTSTYADDPCPSLFARMRNSVSAYAKEYAGEIKAQGRVRMFVRDPPTEGITWTAGGFLARIEELPKNGAWYKHPIKTALRKSHVKFSEWKTGVTPSGTYIPTPFSGLHDLPATLLSKFFLKQGRTFTRPVKFAMSTTTAEVIRYTINEYDNKKFLEATAEINRANAAQLDDYIQHDFRMADVRAELEDGTITQAQAREFAALVKASMSVYYSFIESGFLALDHESQMTALLEFAPFSPINYLKTNGAPIEPGYEYLKGFTPTASPAVIEQMTFKHMKLIASYQIFDDVIKRPESKTAMLVGPDMKDFLEVLNDPHAKDLFKFRESGKLTDSQLIWRLQQYAYWKTQFEQWELLKVTRLQKDENGEFIKTALKLENVCSEIKDLIEAGMR